MYKKIKIKKTSIFSSQLCYLHVGNVILDSFNHSDKCWNEFLGFLKDPCFLFLVLKYFPFFPWKAGIALKKLPSCLPCWCAISSNRSLIIPPHPRKSGSHVRAGRTFLMWEPSVTSSSPHISSACFSSEMRENHKYGRAETETNWS